MAELKDAPNICIVYMSCAIPKSVSKRAAVISRSKADQRLEVSSIYTLHLHPPGLEMELYPSRNAKV